MSLYEKSHYKECTPDVTVNKLLGILRECGIETEELWSDRSSVDTYSLRVSIKGTNIGTNGKGVTKEYARASAYAEFFERFQNAALNHYAENSDMSYRIANDERALTAAELIDDDNSFIRLYFNDRNMLDAPAEDRARNYTELNSYDADNENKYIALPFYSLRDKRVVYIPHHTYITTYGSNGMCAGNTVEEALVQGLSEIIERVVQKRILKEKPALPTIPEEYIKKYPYIYDMLTKAKSNPNFTVLLKDCSFGGKYPAAALCIIEKNTGNFGIKLGCHPNMGIAMERCFTEATQGTDIFEYSRTRSRLDFSDKGVDDDTNIINSYKVGLAKYPFEIFNEKSDYPFTIMPDVSECSNAVILKNWLNELLSEYDVLIRNVSFTGFPSFHIIIPGLSETKRLSDYDIRAQNTRMVVSQLLSSPRDIDKSNVKYIIGALKLCNSSILENTLDVFYRADTELKLPFNEVGSSIYLLSMCYALKGDFENAQYYISILVKRAQSKAFNKQVKIGNEVKDKLSIIFYYLSGMNVLNSHEDVIKYLRAFFDENLCVYVDYLFKSPEDIIAKQYSDVILKRLPFYDDFRIKVSRKYKDCILNQNELARLLG